MIIASIMTGTSVDGVDIAVVDTDKKIQLQYFEYTFSNEEKIFIESHLYPNIIDTKKISSFNFWFSELVGNYFNKTIFKHEIEGVVFHGQTIFHDPNAKLSFFKSTLQLGNGAYLSQKIKKNVLWDLRSGDLANGGQGAPLVIFPDKYFFFKKEPIAIINIGGISNISYISKNKIIAFDLGPGNSLIDAYVKKEWSLKYDIDGKLAAKGKIIPELLANLMKDEYVNKNFPKSTGKEYFNLEFINSFIKNKKYLNYDVLLTLTSFTANVIAKHILEIDPLAIVMIAGGGANNKTLFKMLEKMLSIVKKLDMNGINHDSREASVFAMFYHFYVNNISIGIQTGSNKKYIAGSLAKY